MSRITAIRTGKRAGRRLNVFLDGRFAFSLEAETAARQGLGIGQELSDGDVEALGKAEGHHRCMSAATRFLGYRPRSESELRDRLHQRGFDQDSIDLVIARLKDRGLVDDTAFALFWQENRQTFSPRSQWLTERELRGKGVPASIISDVVRDTDDGDSAYRAALPRARRLRASDYQTFRRRLGQFLKRRGFGYEVISGTVGRLWQELETQGMAEA